MLDHVSISHQSGLILWSKSFTPAFSALALTPASPVNSLVKDAFIEGHVNSEDQGFEKDGYSVRWSVENGLGLVFVVVYPALLPLTYIPNLLSRTKELFLAMFTPYLRALVDTLKAGSFVLDDATAKVLRSLRAKMEEDKWDLVFDRCTKNCEGSRSTMAPNKQAHLIAGSGTSSFSDEQLMPISAEVIAKNMQSLKSRMRKGRGKTASPSPTPSPSRKSNSAAKLMRKWNDHPVTAEDMAALDFSTPADETVSAVDPDSLVSAQAMGTRSRSGEYHVAEWDYRPVTDIPSEEEILSRAAIQAPAADSRAQNSRWTSMLSRLAGRTVLSKDDLDPVLADMERHLMAKNVAKDIAEKLCEGVGTALVGKKMISLTSIKSQVQASLSLSLTRVLTPRSSTDILLDIQRKRAASIGSPEPYAVTFVGVNGVGKSTNLSKVCFWLLQNGLRVLIAACDTFRSGAVEQLRVHVRNLGTLSEGLGEKQVELYERGYGKDAAGIAKDAIAYAKDNGFDVVLIDTAGRMQDNEPLMRALAKLVTVNHPDKIVFVGEALVGNEAVDQLTKFDRSLKDFSAAGGAQRQRGIDGIILTKFDTIDDKVGAALSMTYVTGQPILFVGCGQTYTDLRQLRVNHIVQALLSS